MKKLIIVVFLALLVVAGLYIYLPETDVERSYREFIPDDVLAVVTQYELEKRIDEFKTSPLGTALDNLEYELIARELNIPAEDLESFLEAKQQAENVTDNSLFKALFGAEVTCALMPFTYRSNVPMQEQLLDNLLIISRPKHGAKLVDFASWIDFSTQTVSKRRYGSHTITRYDLEDGRRISGIRKGDLLVMSFNETVLTKGLDVHDKDALGLDGVEDYSNHIDRFTGATLIAYTNFQNITDLIDTAAQHSMAEDASITYDKDAISGYRTGLFGAWRHDDRIIDRAIITISPENLDELKRDRLQADPREPVSYQNVGSDTILYHWTNQFNSSYLMEIAGASEFEPGKQENHPLQQIQTISGLSVEQIAGLFTGDLTFTVNELENDQLVPLPQFLLELGISDMEQLRSSVDRAIEYFSIPVRRKRIGEEGELVTWGGIVGIGSVLPAFAFHGDSLIISSNRERIRMFISDGGEKESLSEKDVFNSVSEELLKPSNTVTFVEFSKVADTLKEMASWGGTMIAIKDRELARKSKILIDELVNPVLDGLSMYKVIASRKFIEDGIINFESQTILEYGKQ